MAGPFGSGANADRRSERAVGTESTSWKRRSRFCRLVLVSLGQRQATDGLVRPYPRLRLLFTLFGSCILLDNNTLLPRF